MGLSSHPSFSLSLEFVPLSPSHPPYIVKKHSKHLVCIPVKCKKKTKDNHTKLFFTLPTPLPPLPPSPRPPQLSSERHPRSPLLVIGGVLLLGEDFFFFGMGEVTGVEEVNAVGGLLVVPEGERVVRGTVCVQVNGLRVIRRKELSRSLVVLTAVAAEGAEIPPGTPTLTVSVERSQLFPPHPESSKVLALCPPIGSTISVSGVPERTARGVVGICCTSAPIVVHRAEGVPMRKVGAGCLTSERRSVCKKAWALSIHGLGQGCRDAHCLFRHDFEDAPGMLLGATQQTAVCGEVVSKKERFKLFAEFLHERYGERFGDGCVVDVAGGRGMLGVALSKLGAVNTVVFDPSAHGRDSRTTAQRVSSGVTRFREEVSAGSHSPEVSRVMSSASLVVGMHPDEATDDIVFLALQHNLPFAVVPCCVFPSLFAHRRLASGASVNTTPELLQYLKETAAKQGVQTAVTSLPFKGSNTVLYSL